MREDKRPFTGLDFLSHRVPCGASEALGETIRLPELFFVKYKPIPLSQASRVKNIQKSCLKYSLKVSLYLAHLELCG